MTDPSGADADEVEITEDLVRSLLLAQHPDLADRSLARVDAGWDNVTFRLGTDLVVRLPRRALAAPLIRHEQRWLPHLAPTLPLPVPTPVRVGAPTDRYPWAWSVTPWFPGRPASLDPPLDWDETAASLGRFLTALHQPAPPDAPSNPYRGMPLADRDEITLARVHGLDGEIAAAEVLACWSRHVHIPRWTGPPRWLHGDLHPANVIVDGGAISAVIDFGDITAGDPATDLAIAWMLLPPSARPRLRAASGVDPDTWARGRGWALTLALAYVTSPHSSPDFIRLGHATIAAVLADEA